MKYFFAFLIAALPFSCSTFKDMGQNQTTEGHFRLYSYPERIKKYIEFEKAKEKDLKELLEVGNKKQQRYEDLVLVSINDFKGKLESTDYNYLDRAQNSNHMIKVGGIAAYKAYFKILRDKLKGNVQFISAGSLFSDKVAPHKIIFYMNYLGIDIAGIGVHDFAMKYKYNYLNYLNEVFRKAQFTPILSNAFDLRSNDQVNFRNIRSSVIKSVGNLKVGYMSLIAPKQVNNIESKKLTGIYFEKLPVKIIKLSNQLRKQGADIIVALIGEGIDCTSQQSQELNIDEYKVNFLEENDKVCDKFNNETIETLKQLPPNYIDVVFTSGKNSKVANMINGYPVLQNYANGNDFSWIKLTFDHKQRKVVQERTQILQPVSTCHNFFKETQDCYTKEVLRNVEVKKAKFLNKKIKIEPIPTHK